MHKYQPRIHVIKKKDSSAAKQDQVSDLEQDTTNAESKTFVFHETEFITVTAYQNQQVRLRSIGHGNTSLYLSRTGYESIMTNWTTKHSPVGDNFSS